MYNWQEVEFKELKNGVDKKGNRLLSLFFQDYFTTFAVKICVSCQSVEEKFYKLKTMQEQNKNIKKEYILKPKFVGIPLSFGSRIRVTNENMTNKFGKELIENHPLGKELFSKFPVKEGKKQAKKA